jgi:hypothetical protein
MSWFKSNSYTIVKMIINQFGIAIMSIIFIGGALGGDMRLGMFGSVFCSLFYLSLLYTMCWDEGAKEGIRADAMHRRKDPLCGLKLALFANIPNALLAFLLLVGFLFGGVITEAAWAQGLYTVAHALALVWESMYLGFVNFFLPPAETVATSGYYLLAYTLTMLPSLFAAWLGYFLGLKNKRMFGSLFAPKKKG